jgi:hypothetical protein
LAGISFVPFASFCSKTVQVQRRHGAPTAARPQKPRAPAKVLKSNVQETGKNAVFRRRCATRHQGAQVEHPENSEKTPHFHEEAQLATKMCNGPRRSRS